MKILIVLVIAIILLIAYLRIKRKVRKLSRDLFGTEDVIEVIKKQRLEESEIPKSLSSMESIYLPVIGQDFPEFNLQEFITIAENQLLSALNAIEAKDISLMNGASEEFIKKTNNIILDLKSKKETQHYDSVKIHRTVLSRYIKKSGICKIVLQTALESVDYRTRDGVIVAGTNQYKKQTRYNMDLVYIQDKDLIDSVKYDNAIGINCPNCGAPVKELGLKNCQYCGSDIKEINIKVWKLTDFIEI